MFHCPGIWNILFTLCILQAIESTLILLRLDGIKNTAWLKRYSPGRFLLYIILDIVNRCRSLLESLGLIVKESKSLLIPTQTISHVGFIWNSVNHTVTIPPDKVSALKDLCSFALSHPISLWLLERTIGIIDSFRFSCSTVPLHYRSLHPVLLKIWVLPNWESIFVLSSSACSDIEWRFGVRSVPSSCSVVFLPFTSDGE